MNYIIENSEIKLSEEEIKGESIKSIIENSTPISSDSIFNITQQLLEILNHLYKLKPQLIHGAINPINILLINNNSIALINSRKSSDDEYDKQFLAPEQINGKVSTQSDIYSLGLSIVALLTRKDILELSIIDEKIQFRRETGIDRYFKNLIDDMIHPNIKYRIKKPKKALKYLSKIKRGKFGVDPFSRQEK